MSEKFLSLNDDQKKMLSASYHAHLPTGYQDLSGYKVLQTEWSFYPGWSYVEIYNPDQEEHHPLSMFFANEKVFVPDCRAASLLKFNGEAPLVVTAVNVTQYIEFFFAHVRMKDGFMRVISSYEDLNWREEPAGTTRKTLSSLIRAPHIISWDEINSSYEVGAHLLFQQHLFECRLHINRYGEIEINERQLQVEDMPLVDVMTA